MLNSVYLKLGLVLNFISKKCIYLVVAHSND